MLELLKMLPAFEVGTITPHDTNAVAKIGNHFPVGIAIGAAGTLRITTLNGTVVNFLAGELAIGVIHPIQFTHVHSTGTTAAPVKAYYAQQPG